MGRLNKTILTWRIKLALALGILAGVGLYVFGQHVARMDDSPNATPLSWGFKSNSANVSTFFETEPVMNSESQPGVLPLPQIDRAIPQETESALFALG